MLLLFYLLVSLECSICGYDILDSNQHHNLMCMDIGSNATKCYKWMCIIGMRYRREV